MIALMEYTINLPKLYQLKDTGKVVIMDEHKNLVGDSFGNLYGSELYEPIPLTFWWMRVFGFSLVANEIIEEYILDNEAESKFIVHRDRMGQWFCILEDGLTKITFVHEIQQCYASFVEHQPQHVLSR